MFTDFFSFFFYASQESIAKIYLHQSCIQCVAMCQCSRMQFPQIDWSTPIATRDSKRRGAINKNQRARCTTADKRNAKIKRKNSLNSRYVVDTRIFQHSFLQRCFVPVVFFPLEEDSGMRKMKVKELAFSFNIYERKNEINIIKGIKMNSKVKGGKIRAFEYLITTVTFETRTFYFSGEGNESRFPSRLFRDAAISSDNNLIHLAHLRKLFDLVGCLLPDGINAYRILLQPSIFLSLLPLIFPCDSKYFAQRKLIGHSTGTHGMPSYVAGKVDGRR